jgi:hypothetical protein
MFDTRAVASPRVELAAVAEHLRPVSLAFEQTLPVAGAFTTLIPGGGLVRGSTLAVTGEGAAVSVALALCIEAASAGSWVAVVGSRRLGLAAADEFGLPLERLVLVDGPEPRLVPAVTAALVDAFELTLVVDQPRLSGTRMRKLVSRNRERGGVLMRVGGADWPDAPDVTVAVAGSVWTGLGRGHGVLRSRRVDLAVSGRRQGGTRRGRIWLPDADGVIRVAGETETVPHRGGRALTLAG